MPDEAIATSFLKPANSGRFSAIYHVKAVRPQNRAQAQALVAEASGRGLELMLQEFLPGPPTLHYFLDGFMDRHGRVCGMLARRRLRMFPPDFGNSTFTESIPLEEIRAAEESLRRLLSGIGYRGVFSAEFKFDARDGLLQDPRGQRPALVVRQLCRGLRRRRLRHGPARRPRRGHRARHQL